ncbi:MAG TPA: hypothetical protein IAD08_07720 [Candidatus Scatovivens faecipullorum]|nr:hypothetical protein [Candidatus Scatovivens faecipullorum]
MKTKKRKLNKLAIRRCIIVFLIIIIFLILISTIINKNKNKYKELTILLNNELLETTKEVIIEDNNIFFSKEDIKTIFDDTIYYNEAEKELITTYNTHVALLKVDEQYALINDQNVELKGKLKEINDTIYLPLTDLESVYDIDLEFSKESNRIIMDSTQKKKVEATVLKRANLENKKGLFSKKIEKLIIGDKVTVLEEDGKYKKIRTALGNIGYVKSKILSDDIVIREEVKTSKQELVVYDGYSNISGIYNNIQVDTSKLNVVIPTFFYIEKNSEVLDKSSVGTATYAVYKNWVDANKLQILPVLTNDVPVSTSLLSYSERSTIINSVKELVKKNNYIGINIDFEKIDDPNSFYRFVLELVPRFKADNLKVFVTLNNTIDRKKIENIVDYIIEE